MKTFLTILALSTALPCVIAEPPSQEGPRLFFGIKVGDQLHKVAGKGIVLFGADHRATTTAAHVLGGKIVHVVLEPCTPQGASLAPLPDGTVFAIEIGDRLYREPVHGVRLFEYHDHDKLDAILRLLQVNGVDATKVALRVRVDGFTGPSGR